MLLKQTETVNCRGARAPEFKILCSDVYLFIGEKASPRDHNGIYTYIFMFTSMWARGKDEGRLGNACHKVTVNCFDARVRPHPPIFQGFQFEHPDTASYHCFVTLSSAMPGDLGE